MDIPKNVALARPLPLSCLHRSATKCARRSHTSSSTLGRNSPPRCAYLWLPFPWSFSIAGVRLCRVGLDTRSCVIDFAQPKDRYVPCEHEALTCPLSPLEVVSDCSSERLQHSI